MLSRASGYFFSSLAKEQRRRRDSAFHQDWHLPLSSCFTPRCSSRCCRGFRCHRTADTNVGYLLSVLLHWRRPEAIYCSRRDGLYVSERMIDLNCRRSEALGIVPVKERFPKHPTIARHRNPVPASDSFQRRSNTPKLPEK